MREIRHQVPESLGDWFVFIITRWLSEVSSSLKLHPVYLGENPFHHHPFNQH